MTHENAEIRSNIERLWEEINVERNPRKRTALTVLIAEEYMKLSSYAVDNADAIDDAG